ncbi:hypothetical protein BKA66DRAFT_549423 [Pyrenochaeta sp. MPI-SDFR-AT-0127]|nr:hypothetical protein BKA66DRAFT_549423 [Pyrenochaeta sp. MPI-SDFR-AT-0127]
MTNVKGQFPFLCLPAELRNHIYEFAASTRANAQNRILPCLSLTQVNRRIRAEYRPICMKVDTTIDWKDFPNYLETFHPTVDGKVTNVELFPASITIFADQYRKDSRDIEIDILPLFKVGLEDENFSCAFVDSVDTAPVRGDNEAEQLKDMLQADSDVVKTLINHRDPEWIAAVDTGTVLKLLISPIGTTEEPYARFHIRHDAVTYLPEDLGWKGCAFENIEISYLKTVGLDTIWMSNEYDFIPQARRVKAI